MTSSPSIHAHSIDMSTIQSTSHKHAPHITPSKRKGSPLGYQASPDTTAQSTPDLLRGEQHANSSLKTPDRPLAQKRNKSASGRSPSAYAVASNDDITASSHLRTPTPCTRKEAYKYKGSRLNHLRICQDPNCKMRPASMQPSASDDDETKPSELQQQQADDMFTTMYPNNEVEPMGFSFSNDINISSEESPFSKLKSDLSAGTAETTGEPHIETPGTGEAADPEPDHLHSEAPPGQNKPNLEVPGHIANKGPADTLSMHNKLRMKFESRLTAKDEKGHIYVIKDLNRPRLCKIGRAKESELRVGTIKNSCGLNIRLVHSRPVDLYTRTEALIQTYLADLCRPYFCTSCDQTHGEWFEIPDELAIAAIEKWINFMCRESPYDPRSKELRPFWSVWVKVHNLASADLDVDDFRMQWDRIMSPSELDHFTYKFKVVWEIVWKFFWPVYATLAWTVTFIASQHPFAFMLMATSVVGTFISMSHDFAPLRHASTRSKR